MHLEANHTHKESLTCFNILVIDFCSEAYTQGKDRFCVAGHLGYMQQAFYFSTCLFVQHHRFDLPDTGRCIVEYVNYDANYQTCQHVYALPSICSTVIVRYVICTGS